MVCRRLLVPIGLLIVASVSLAASARVEQLSWLAGCWASGTESQLSEECWLHPAGGTMLGLNRTATADGAAFEFLRIARDGDDLVYFASPSGRFPPTPFRLVEQGESYAVFANPEHDFPQRITYRLEGDRLTARVEARAEGSGGDAEGSWDGFDLTWSRSTLAGTVDTASARASLDAAERAFARSVAERDRAAFESFLAPDAVFVAGSVRRGREAIVEGWAAFFDETGPELTWEPETVEVRARGDLGLTRGPYTLSAAAPDGSPIDRTGTFTSVWQAMPDGSWQVVFDAGCPVGD